MATRAKKRKSAQKKMVAEINKRIADAVNDAEEAADRELAAEVASEIKFFGLDGKKHAGETVDELLKKEEPKLFTFKAAFPANFHFFDFGDDKPIWRETIVDKRDALVNEVTNLDDFAKCFDLRNFPLPMDVSYEEHNFMCHCGRMGFRKTLHVGMKIVPRNEEELQSVPREADGTVRLKTCVGIDAYNFKELGNQACFEKVRAGIRNMALHEVYESVQFRGMRIFDPHNESLRPKDQPF